MRRPDIAKCVAVCLLSACSGAQVRCLKPCTRQALEKLKEAEETKEKTYQVGHSLVSPLASWHLT